MRCRYLSAFTSLAQLFMTALYIYILLVCETPDLLDLDLNRAPENFKSSLQCLFGENVMTRAEGYDCVVDPVCGYDKYHRCCDSCDGTINSAQAMAAGYLVLYVISNSLFSVLAFVDFRLYLTYCITSCL